MRQSAPKALENTPLRNVIVAGWHPPWASRLRNGGGDAPALLPDRLFVRGFRVWDGSPVERAVPAGRPSRPGGRPGVGTNGSTFVSRSAGSRGFGVREDRREWMLLAPAVSESAQGEDD